MWGVSHQRHEEAGISSRYISTTTWFVCIAGKASFFSLLVRRENPKSSKKKYDQHIGSVVSAKAMQYRSFGRSARESEGLPLVKLPSIHPGRTCATSTRRLQAAVHQASGRPGAAAVVGRTSCYRTRFQHAKNKLNLE